MTLVGGGRRGEHKIEQKDIPWEIPDRKKSQLKQTGQQDRLT